MRLNAYVLAADPAWIELSVRAYYGRVSQIIVSFDRNDRGWTGAPIAARECVARLRAIDVEKKMRFVQGDFARPGFTPMENDTYQRQIALDLASENADWVLQIDTDEFLPDADSLCQMIHIANDRQANAIEWPMRVLFRQLPDQRFLEVCSSTGSDRFEYPGPIAIRPGAKLTNARRSEGTFLRPVVDGDTDSLQISRAVEPGEIRVSIRASQAIIHNSWGRDAASIKSKIASWSHHEGWRSRLFYLFRWKPAPLLWRSMRDLHPFAKGLWPALKPCEGLPPSLQGNILKP
jgi:hypothetical protein